MFLYSQVLQCLFKCVFPPEKNWPNLRGSLVPKKPTSLTGRRFCLSTSKAIFLKIGLLQWRQRWGAGGHQSGLDFYGPMVIAIGVWGWYCIFLWISCTYVFFFCELIPNQIADNICRDMMRSQNWDKIWALRDDVVTSQMCKQKVK